MSDEFDWAKEDAEVTRMLALLEEECNCDPDHVIDEVCPHDEAKAFFAPGGHAEELQDAVAARVEEHIKEHPIVYGGVGENWDAPRRLICFVTLPDRRKETFQARNLLLESDIREAMAVGARRLHNRYLERYSVLGFVFDPDLIEYDTTRLAIGMDQGADTAIKHTEGLARVLVCTVVIKRA